MPSVAQRSRGISMIAGDSSASLRSGRSDDANSRGDEKLLVIAAWIL